MDGRKAAFNVIVGMVIGACVPIVAAVVLRHAFDGFRPLDHPFTLLFLSLACSAIGVFVNLPWATPGPSTQAFMRGEPLGATDESAPPGPGAGGGEPGAAREAGNEPRERRKMADAPPKRYAMSRREALRELALEHNADDDAVRDAYRRLAKEHHPDHANTEGPEAVAEATRKFVRIREAYEVLIDEA